MEFQKIVNVLDTAPNDENLPKFTTKKWIEVYDQSERNTALTKKLELKLQCQDQIYVAILMQILL